MYLSFFKVSQFHRRRKTQYHLRELKLRYGTYFSIEFGKNKHFFCQNRNDWLFSFGIFLISKAHSKSNAFLACHVVVLSEYNSDVLFLQQKTKKKTGDKNYFSKQCQSFFLSFSRKIIFTRNHFHEKSI